MSGVRHAIISFGKSSVGEHGEAGRAVRQTQVWSCVRESGQGQRGSADHHTVSGRFGKAIGSPDSQGLPVSHPGREAATAPLPGSAIGRD